MAALLRVDFCAGIMVKYLQKSSVKVSDIMNNLNIKQDATRKQKTKIKVLFDNRYFLAAFFFVSSVIIAAIFGGIFYLISSGDSGFFKIAFVCYLWFCAPAGVSSILLAVTKIDEDWTFGLGPGLYYGSIAVAAITESAGWHMSDADRYFLGFVISALVCYIVYTKHHRSE